MARVNITMAAYREAKRKRMDKSEDNSDPGTLPSRLRGEFFTDAYANLFEEAGKKLYQNIIEDLVGTKGPDGNVLSRGKLPELFDAAVQELSQQIQTKKGTDGLKDNAQMFAPWIKAVVNDVRTLGMQDIMKSLESLAHDHSVKVVDDSLLGQPMPEILPEPEGLEDDDPLVDEMAIPEAAETPEIPELSAEDVEGMLKGDDVPGMTPAAPPPAQVAQPAPAPAGAAPGAPVTPILPVPQAQPMAAATTMKDMRRKLQERRPARQVVAEATETDLLQAAAANLQRLEDTNG